MSLVLRGRCTWESDFFVGIDVSAELGRSFFPIVNVDKKKIHVDRGTNIEKISSQVPCRDNAEYGLYLFFMDSESIALSNPVGLKPLNDDDFLKFQNALGGGES